MGLLATYMAWKHKEEWFEGASYYKDGYDMQKGDFTKWLDEQCKGGWEVLKIARDFQSDANRTWVVFRREV